jgi:hypothetical protein
VCANTRPEPLVRIIVRDPFAQGPHSASTGTLSVSWTVVTHALYHKSCLNDRDSRFKRGIPEIPKTVRTTERITGIDESDCSILIVRWVCLIPYAGWSPMGPRYIMNAVIAGKDSTQPQNSVPSVARLRLRPIGCNHSQHLLDRDHPSV